MKHLKSLNESGMIFYPGSKVAKVQGYVDGKKAKLDYINVKPSQRKEGVGRAEVEKFEAWAKSVGAEYVEIDVFKTSQEFWKKMGYEIDKDFPVIGGYKQDYKDGRKVLEDWASENPELDRIRYFKGSVDDMHTWMKKKLKEQGMEPETNPYRDVEMVNGPQQGQKDKSLPYQDFQNGESDLVKNRHNGKTTSN
jgi:hypothetical protein